VRIKFAWRVGLDATGKSCEIVDGEIAVLHGEQLMMLSSSSVPKWKTDIGEAKWLRRIGSNIAAIAEWNIIFLTAQGTIMKRLSSSLKILSTLSGEDLIVQYEDRVAKYSQKGEELTSLSIEKETEVLGLSSLGPFVKTEEGLKLVDFEGMTLWKRELESPLLCAESEGINYVSTSSELFALDLDGRVLWTKPLDMKVEGIRASGLVGLISQEGALVFDQKGSQVWRTDVGGRDISVSPSSIALLLPNTLEFFDDLEGAEMFYEVMCRGSRGCGIFVSSKYTDRCPKCGSSKVFFRAVKKRIRV